MRLSIIGKIVTAAGVIASAWGFAALLGAAAQVSGGSYGPQPGMDFAIEHLLLGGPAIFFFGVMIWIVGAFSPGRSAPAETDSTGADSTGHDSLRDGD